MAATALRARFQNTCLMRPPSTSANTGSAGATTTSLCPLFSSGEFSSRSVVSRASATRSVSTAWSFSGRAKSRKSSVILDSRSDSLVTMSIRRSARSLSAATPSRRSICREPEIEASGLRIS